MNKHKIREKVGVWISGDRKGEIVLFRETDRQTTLEVRLEKDTVWLSLNQIADLFARDKSVISRHLRNIYKEKELNRKATVAFFATVQNEGRRPVSRDVEFFNLDAIISVGYRVNSKRGTQFRIWATDVLKDHLVKGYSAKEPPRSSGRKRTKASTAPLMRSSKPSTGRTSTLVSKKRAPICCISWSRITASSTGTNGSPPRSSFGSWRRTAFYIQKRDPSGSQTRPSWPSP